jgi:hypothetical protein
MILVQLTNDYKMAKLFEEDKLAALHLLYIYKFADSCWTRRILKWKEQSFVFFHWIPIFFTQIRAKKQECYANVPAQHICK